ncbi:MAG: hypothetical protein ABL888_21320 [Pirellulaceae bacterium]
MMPKDDFISALRESQVQGFRYVTGQLDKIAEKNSLTLFGQPPPERSIAQAAATFRSCLPYVRTIVRIEETDGDICPWTVGYINGKNNFIWPITLSQAGDPGWCPWIFEFIASWEPKRFSMWDEEIYQPVNSFQKNWLGWINNLEQPFKEVDEIARKLKGLGSSRFRYLASHPKGVSFSDFCNSRDPFSGQRLTESEDFDSIKAMLMNLSGELRDYGYQISVSIPKNLIKLKKVQKN